MNILGKGVKKIINQNWIANTTMQHKMSPCDLASHYYNRNTQNRDCASADTTSTDIASHCAESCANKRHRSVSASTSSERLCSLVSITTWQRYIIYLMSTNNKLNFNNIIYLMFTALHQAPVRARTFPFYI